MDISSGNWSLTLDLNGGRIEELTHEGVRIFGTYNRIDGKIGNTHLCIPSFDKEGIEEYGLPFHGLVRNILWTTGKATQNSLSLSIVTQPTVFYPASLRVTQTFILTDVFVHSVSITHISGEPVPVNCGIHYYWDTPEGWHGTQINGVNMNEAIETNGFIGQNGTNIITFPHATYKLVSNGFHSAVLWTSFKTIENEKKEYSQDFCCIEPVIGWPHYFGSEKSMLKRGEVKTISLSLCAGERT